LNQDPLPFHAWIATPAAWMIPGRPARPGVFPLSGDEGVEGQPIGLDMGYL